MLYYIKKAWLDNLLTVLCLIAENICKVGVSLNLMWSFQQIIERDFLRFIIMLSGMISLWIIIFLLQFFTGSLSEPCYI